MAKQILKPRVRKKKWFPVIAPKLFKERVIGEIPLYESKAMLNRILSINMMNLTGNPRNQHINVVLRINEVKEGKGLTSILGFEMMPSSIKRIVRRGRTKIDDSVIVATNDNKKVRIKPLIITNTIINKSIANSIRLVVRKNLAGFASRLSFEKLVEEIMSFKLQNYLGSTASKIAPIRSSEIRRFRLVEKEGIRVMKPVKMKEVKELVRKRKEELKEEKPATGVNKEEINKEEAKEEKKKEKPKKEEVKENPVVTRDKKEAKK